ncbi:hypothetical protein [Hamadaea tsunoensis]|uniref:hypothetical protein n=1 Tax=Hamadaea tsunoensis TaxID=53368 RepID=UPI000405A1F5|nr:hypothetical protein [Hamadaea tsunoensis]
MRHRRSIIVIDDFYRDPLAVRRYALGQSFYTPYEDEAKVRAGIVAATWWATRFRAAAQCPVKSSGALLAALEQAVGEPVDRDHWNAPFAVDAAANPLPTADGRGQSCLWNGCFHVKPDNGQQLGNGVHNHVTDQWNGVGPDGWAGIVYLSPDAPLDGGLHLWRNTRPGHDFDWMTPAENWQRVDSFGNVFNRLILVRGDVPHSGARGWGSRIEEGRLYQTFFFRTTPARHDPVALDGVDG